jgi:precorrin-6Y C5,15-methyltransferase (decarboxylating)
MISQQWLSVIGIGEDGWAGLSAIARSLIEQAEIIYGGDRHLEMVREMVRAMVRVSGQNFDQKNQRKQNHQQIFTTWRSPIEQSIEQIQGNRGKRVCVLASGDPLWFGIGTTLLKKIAIAEMLILPSPSTFSYIFARLGWSLPEIETLSLCGRPAANLQPYIYPNAKLLILSANGDTPQTVAKMLCDRHFSHSKITILEHLNGDKERIIATTAKELGNQDDFADLNAIAVECVASPEAIVENKMLSRMAGLPDSAYDHDGQLTKSEVRAVTLAALAPNAGELLWDVGAGCGSIAIEWMRSHPRCQAIAIEKCRSPLIAANAIALGTANLQIITGHAPDALQGLPSPDAIFIGGGATATGLMEVCWQNLRSQGRIVANVVTLEGEQQLWQWYQRYGGTLTQITISRAEAIGSFVGWKPMRPVTQWQVIKK